MFGRRRSQGGRAWGFCGGLGWEKDVDTLEGQGVLGEAGAVWTGFRVIKLAVSEGTANGAEAYDVVGDGVHANNYGREKEEVSKGVIVVVGAAWLGAVALC